MSEKTETKKVCDYLKSLDIFYYAIPAVCFNKKQGGFPIGYKKGMPDLCIPILNLYIEMKDINPGKVKEHEEVQAKTHLELIKAGKKVFRCEGYEKAKEVVNQLIII